MKRLNVSSDVPEARLGILIKTHTSSKKKTRPHSTIPRRNGYSRLRQHKSRKRVDSQGEHFKGIHDRFRRYQVYRESQLAIGWNEQNCIEMDELAKQNHTYNLSKEEQKYQGQWYLTLNKSGKNAPMRLRPDFRAAVSLKKPSSS